MNDPACSKLRLFGCLLAVIAVGRIMPLVVPLFSADDYMHMSEGRWTFSLQAISQGRPVQAFLGEVANLLGITGRNAGVLGWVALSLSLAYAAIVTCRAWGLSAHSVQAAIVGAIVVGHPFQTEIYTFNAVTWMVALAFYLAFAGLDKLIESPARWWAGVSLLAAAIGIYQVVLNHIAIVVLGRAVLLTIEHSKPKDSGVVKLAISLAVSAIVYLLVAKAVAAFFGAPTIDERANLLGIDQLPVRIKEIAQTTFISISPSASWSALQPPLVTASLFAVAGLSVWGLLKNAIQSADVKMFVIPAALVVISGFAVVGVAAVGQVFWPVPRVLSAVAVWWALVTAVALKAAGGGGIRRTAVVFCAGVAIVGFSGVSNRIFQDQFRVNTWDRLMAQRIVQRLEARQDFAQIKRIAVVGGSYTYPIPLATTIGDMNISARLPGWSKVNMINQYTGYAFGGPTESDLAEAAEIGRERPTWPADEAVVVRGDVAFIFLEP